MHTHKHTHTHTHTYTTMHTYTHTHTHTQNCVRFYSCVLYKNLWRLYLTEYTPTEEDNLQFIFPAPLWPWTKHGCHLHTKFNWKDASLAAAKKTLTLQFLPWRNGLNSTQSWTDWTHSRTTWLIHVSPKFNLKFCFTNYLGTRFSPVVIAWLEEMQACVTVCAGTRSEIPAPRAAWQSSGQSWKTLFTQCSNCTFD